MLSFCQFLSAKQLKPVFMKIVWYFMQLHTTDPAHHVPSNFLNWWLSQKRALYSGGFAKTLLLIFPTAICRDLGRTFALHKKFQHVFPSIESSLQYSKPRSLEEGWSSSWKFTMNVYHSKTEERFVTKNPKREEWFFVPPAFVTWLEHNSSCLSGFY